MKNIFRKTIQKVRNTAAKAVDAMREHPELCTLGVFAALTIGTAMGQAIREHRKGIKLANLLNDDTTALNAEVVLNVFEHVHEALKTAHENGDIDSENRLKISTDIVTRDDADVLSGLRLYNEASGMLNISYWPDKDDFDGCWLGRRESEKTVSNPKTDEEVFGPVGYHSDALVETFRNVCNAFQSAYDAGDVTRHGCLNLNNHGVRQSDADILKLLGLYVKNSSVLRLFYWLEDGTAVFSERN